MLFNSYPFIFVFLPLVIVVFFQFARVKHVFAAGFLVAASLFFYGWWNPAYIGLLAASIVFNYSAGVLIAGAAARQADRAKKWLLYAAILGNLGLLGYYKYANFFVSNLNHLAGTSLVLDEIVLPLGISFFTFTQITLLVDTFRGEVKEYNFVHYALFVTYFPHLIAGPILHHKEMMPQFAQPATYRFTYENLAVGMTVFVIGLSKKVILADGIAPYATPVFAAAEAGRFMTFLESWSGALAYTLQLYFDFSGYSDMAIGLSRTFGVILPLNFASPYKAPNIIEFWRRWHMTLSRFLRDYLYIPLGGGRKGLRRRYGNLMATMLLGGLWHGAGWTFVVWGGLHGFYLVVNHGFQALCRARGAGSRQPSRWVALIGRLVTFVAVVIGWVFFRSDTLQGAWTILTGMSGRHGFALPDSWTDTIGWRGMRALQVLGFEFNQNVVQTDLLGLAWIVSLLFAVWVMPNTQQIMNRFKPGLSFCDGQRSHMLQWEPSTSWLLVVGALLGFSLVALGDHSEFLYFRF